MNLFEFLDKISKEKFPFHLHYVEWSSTVEVHVDAFYERWVVSFNQNDFVNYTRLAETEANIENLGALSELFERPKKTWGRAAKDLGITFVTPYSFSFNGNEYHVTGLLPDFGSGKGTLITSRKDLEEACLMASLTKQYNMSGLNPYHYDRYSRDHIIETLNDWGWCGKGKPPSWFKGEINQ